jgi:hypothetical protein
MNEFLHYFKACHGIIDRTGIGSPAKEIVNHPPDHVLLYVFWMFEFQQTFDPINDSSDTVSEKCKLDDTSLSSDPAAILP